MSIITRINKFFTQPEPSGLLGISIRQEALAICAIDEKEAIDCHTVKVNGDSFVDAIKNLKAPKSLMGQCHLILSAQQNQLVQVDKPQVPENEINAALKWQIKDLVSIPPEDMIVDYYDGPTMAGGLEKINVVCASKNELAALVENINQNHCQIKSITVEEFAFASLAPIEDDARLMVCQQPNEEILLIIVKNGALFFQRRLRGMAKIANQSIDELSMGIIDSLSLEIQRSTDYFERQLKQAPIRSIEILVPMEHEAYLARKLAENTNVVVNLFNMPENYSKHREFAACIGATMLNHLESTER